MTPCYKVPIAPLGGYATLGVVAAQWSSLEFSTASGLQGPRAKRWVAQHIPFCPLAGVLGWVLPTCAQGLVEPSSRWLGERENKWSSFWGLVLLLLILVTALLVSTWIHVGRGHRHSGQRPSRSTVHLPSRGRTCWVGGRRWRLSRRRQFHPKVSFTSLLYLFFLEKTLLFFQEFVSQFLFTAGYACCLVGAHSMLP